MGRAINDLKGKRFGMLLVLEKDEEKTKEYGRAYWVCQCDCGTIKSVRGNHLGKSVVSCGCKKHTHKDLTGQRFGRLVVVSKNEEVSEQKKSLHWNCKCDCGNEKIIWGSDLKRGKTQSCGCLNNELSKERMEEYLRTHKGKLSPNYKQELTDEERELKRNTDGYDEWRKDVKEKANYTCDCCGKRGGNLHSHHLYSYSIYKDLRTDIHNGVCLCEHCHKKFHKLYGNRHNTKEQYEEFKALHK